MTKEKAFEVVYDAILHTDPAIDVNNITPSADLVDDFGFDSLDVVECCITIEDELHVEKVKEFEEFMSLKHISVQQLVNIVEKL